MLAEHAIPGAFNQLGFESEEVVDAEKTEVLDVEPERGVQLVAQALGFNAEVRTLFDE